MTEDISQNTIETWEYEGSERRLNDPKILEDENDFLGGERSNEVFDAFGFLTTALSNGEFLAPSEQRLLWDARLKTEKLIASFRIDELDPSETWSLPRFRETDTLNDIANIVSTSVCCVCRTERAKAPEDRIEAIKDEHCAINEAIMDNLEEIFELTGLNLLHSDGQGLDTVVENENTDGPELFSLDALYSRLIESCKRRLPPREGLIEFFDKIVRYVNPSIAVKVSEDIHHPLKALLVKLFGITDDSHSGTSRHVQIFGRNYRRFSDDVYENPRHVLSNLIREISEMLREGASVKDIRGHVKAKKREFPKMQFNIFLDQIRLFELLREMEFTEAVETKGLTPLFIKRLKIRAVDKIDSDELKSILMRMANSTDAN